MFKLFVFLFVLLSAPTTVSTGSHSLRLIATYITGETPFPEFSGTLMLDDVTVGHYNSETKRYIPRQNTTHEDELVSFYFYSLRDDLHPFLRGQQTFKNYTESPQLYQIVSHCELMDNDKPGQMITKFAFSGSTTDEMHYHDNKFTYEGPREKAIMSFEVFKWVLETIHYPKCIANLRDYLKKRHIQVNKKVKPRVRLIQKANSDSGGIRVSCLATGFYPRHLNLSLFRDGQPVSDHEVTGGDLLPNGDGTYQMRKSLEIRGDERHKHTYSCSITHLSLDNSMTVDLEFDHGKPFKSVIPSVLTVLGLVLVFGAIVVIWRKWHKDSSDSEYSSASYLACEETSGTSQNVEVHDMKSCG